MFWSVMGIPWHPRTVHKFISLIHFLAHEYDYIIRTGIDSIEFVHELAKTQAKGKLLEA